MEIEDLLNSPFSFNRRKVFTPCETRPLWKGALVVLIVGVTGREKRCSLKKIHTANWLTKSREHLDELSDWSQSKLLFAPNIRLDPFIDKAIELIAASGYARKTDGKIELTTKGEQFFEQLESDKELMIEEKLALKVSKKYLSEAAVERIFKAN
ncbi:hypothetical protein [Pseudomonas cavernae]|uniref:hypothetical protein n=1 Tax=Pseudomonas cavernae TaxID=2320867 RepID=UPI0013C51B6F|nr:hypothetical protein [Pseudomonas cavernae]